MTPLCTTCASCHRSWALWVDDSLYLELDLVSRPCPNCEAYTLSCLGRAAAAVPYLGVKTTPGSYGVSGAFLV
jgi:hypothetical protein